MHPLDELRFENLFTTALPGDPARNGPRRQVHRACYSFVDPTPVASPKLLALSAEVAADLGLSVDASDPAELAAVLAGNRTLPGMLPYAACYGGHQFGHWAGQLGDGRAITLGELTGPDGVRREVQLKGAGPTPYSRTADGRAVLRSSLREFLCSEAMHHLGVPTTRALSLVTTGDAVVRDMFYDGRAAPEPGAITCRVAPSFLRFGNYQLLAARGELDTLRELVRFTLQTYFPTLIEAGEDPLDKQVLLRWLREVGERTANMIAHWMRVGFVHGVMNTDNMSVLGLTIDYGPYGWLDDYDPSWTPNTTDASGRRYCFGRQPSVGLWNLARFAEALHPLIEDEAALVDALDAYGETFERAQRATWRDKLGLRSFEPETDDALTEELLEILQLQETDYTIFFRQLVHGELAPLELAFYAPDAVVPEARARLAAWMERYTARVTRDAIPEPDRRAQMNAANPSFVLRNYVAQLAIDATEADHGETISQLLELARHPYADRSLEGPFTGKRPEWARHRPGCSTLSCSS